MFVDRDEIERYKVFQQTPQCMSYISYILHLFASCVTTYFGSFVLTNAENTSDVLPKFA